VIHDQEIARLPHRRPKTSKDFQDNFIEIERLLNKRLSYIPWTLSYPSGFTFNNVCTTATKIVNGSDGILTIVKEHDWTALTVDFHSSFQTSIADSAFDFYVEISDNLGSVDLIPIGEAYLEVISAQSIDVGHSMTSGEVGNLTFSSGDVKPLRAGRYDISIWAQRNAGVGALRYNQYSYFWIRVLEHPPAPRLT
jgi:hypothetical protein